MNKSPSTFDSKDDEHHRLVIVGAGMGGLLAARVMQRSGFDVVVYERDSSPEDRTQGGVLDLHPESGQWALTQAGLDAEFRALARPEGEDLRILDKDGEILWENIASESRMTRPEVDRPRLRELLIDSVRSDTIRWDHQLVSIELEDDHGYHLLRFANGKTITAGVVVGADGAGSRVRSLVTDAHPSYTGVSFIEISISEVDRSHPELARMVGRGSMFALADDKGFIAQRNGDGRIRVYIAFRMPEGAFADMGIAFDDPAGARAAILDRFDGWSPQITRLIGACDDLLIPRSIKAMPTGANWSSKQGVTLLGDAAHQMSPFAGAGANLAMQDGAEFALAMMACTDPALAIARYESSMFKRAEEAARRSAEGLEMCISPDGSARFAKQMQVYRGS